MDNNDGRSANGSRGGESNGAHTNGVNGVNGINGLNGVNGVNGTHGANGAAPPHRESNEDDPDRPPEGTESDTEEPSSPWEPLPPSENTYVVIHSHSAANDAEFTIEPGERLEVIEQSDTGWWLARRLNPLRLGWVPANFLRALTEEERQIPQSAREEMGARRTEEVADPEDPGH